MEATRERWTDDRMDDLVNHVGRGFAQVDARFAEVHNDMAALRAEQTDIRKELSEKATRQELSNLQSEINQRFDRMQSMLLTGFLTLVVTIIATQFS